MAQVELERTAITDVVHPTMNWGAIIAGWVVAVGIAFLMYVGGLAMGFSAFDAHDAAASAKGIGIGTVAWLILTWVVSLLAGGMFASWFDGRDDSTNGAMHGITVWGLSIAASGLLVAMGLGGAVGSSASLIGAGASHASASQHGGSKGMDDDTGLLQAQLMQRIRQSGKDANAATAPTAAVNAQGNGMTRSTGGRRIDSRTASAATLALLADRADTAKAILAANTDMSQSDIDSTVQGLSAQVSETKAKLKDAADKAAHYTAMAMWVLFLCVLLSLLAAALGGSLGASHVHRVYHLRRYARSVPLR